MFILLWGNLLIALILGSLKFGIFIEAGRMTMQKDVFSVYSEKCPSRNVLEAISDKWSILIINILSMKICRFGELRREVGGISPKMLMQTLQKLERYGFVDRKSYPVLPMKVEYSLTVLGMKLSVILGQLTLWTEMNMSSISQAERSFISKLEHEQKV
nr:helix-turn-helix domain-containing protein [Legionella bononiensis]